ncbi:MAG: 3-keto-5-aminohexanoate cleavage protein [Nitrospinota bacterium]
MEFDPLVITCAVTGAELTKKETPYLPVTPDEIALSAIGAVSEGASIIHLHVRDEKGLPTQRAEIFKEVTDNIKKHCNPIIQFSTGGAVGTPVDERIAPLSLQPEMASLSLGTMNFGEEIFENSEATIRTISETLKKNGVMPELEIFDYGMLDSVPRLIKKGYIPKKFHVDFVLGVPGGMNGGIEELVTLARRLSPGQSWSVAGIGRFQLPLALHALCMGGHVRVGLEDNMYYSKGVLAKSNASLVRRIGKIAKEFGRPVASPDETRTLLGL